jgi:hypothetical protein
MKLEKG